MPHAPTEREPSTAIFRFLRRFCALLAAMTAPERESAARACLAARRRPLLGHLHFLGAPPETRTDERSMGGGRGAPRRLGRAVDRPAACMVRRHT